MEALSDYSALSWAKKFKGTYASIKRNNETIVVLKPETFMNKSGESIGAAVRFFKADATSVIVIHDDLELPFGEVRLKHGGGTAGHNGLKSINAGIGSGEFSRLRLGIGRPTRGSVSAYVLSRFSTDEEIVLDRYIEGAAAILEKILSGTNEHGQSSVRLI